MLAAVITPLMTVSGAKRPTNYGPIRDPLAPPASTDEKSRVARAFLRDF
jgi:hypothetical protein